MSEQTGDRDDPDRFKRLDIAIALVPFLGGVTLVIVAVAYEAYYDVFNLRTAEVGLDSVGVVNRAYASLLLYLALASTLAAFVALLWRHKKKPSGNNTSVASRRVLQMAAAFSVWVFALASQAQAPEFNSSRVAAYLQGGLGHDITLFVSEWYVSVPLFALLVLFTTTKLVKGQYFGATALTMLVLTLVLGLVILIASAYKTGLYTAFRLLDEGPRANYAFGPALTWFSVPTPCVNPIWIGSEPAPSALPSRNVVYMGESSGTTLLLDLSTGNITRLPSGQLMLQETTLDCSTFTPPTAPSDNGATAPEE